MHRDKCEEGSPVWGSPCAGPILHWFGPPPMKNNCSGNALGHGRNVTQFQGTDHLHSELLSESQQASSQSHHMPGNVLNPSQAPSYLILSTILWHGWYHPRFTEGKTKALGGWVRYQFHSNDEWGFCHSTTGLSDPKPALNILSHPKEKFPKRLHLWNSQC